MGVVEDAIRAAAIQQRQAPQRPPGCGIYVPTINEDGSTTNSPVELATFSAILQCRDALHGIGRVLQQILDALP